MGTGRIVSIQSTRERGGAEYANLDLLDGLRSRGHDVLLVTDLPEIAEGSEVPVRRVELGPKLGKRTARKVIRNAPVTLWRIARLLRAERPVAVTLLHFKKEQLLCALLPRRLTGRVVWAEWGPVPAPMRGGVARHLYRLAAGRASHVLAVSEDTRASVVATGVDPARVSVVANLVDLERLRFDAEARRRLRVEWDVGAGTFVVGVLSRLQRRKRIDVAIDAVGRLDGDVLLVLAGEGETESELRRRAAPLGRRVRFVRSPRDRVQEFLSACDVLLFTPSPTEGAPRVISEAQLVGLPVLATADPGTAGMIGPGTGAVASVANDVPATVALLEAYGTDPERRRREGEASRRAARHRHEPVRLLAEVETLLGLAVPAAGMAGGLAPDAVRPA